MKKEDIARVCHEANRAYCETLGDYTHLPWEAADSWQKESAIKGVQFHLDNPNAGPEASHNEWMAHKLAEGWQYGEVKEPAKKLHPCLVPFHELPAEQQIKDHLFRAVVHSLDGRVP